MRNELQMVKYVMDSVEYGNEHFASCREIICLINETRKKVSNPYQAIEEHARRSFWVRAHV